MNKFIKGDKVRIKDNGDIEEVLFQNQHTGYVHVTCKIDKLQVVDPDLLEKVENPEGL